MTGSPQKQAGFYLTRRPTCPREDSLPRRLLHLLLSVKRGLIQVMSKVLALLQCIEVLCVDMCAFLIRFILIIRRIENVTWGATSQGCTEADYEHCPLYPVSHGYYSPYY